MRAIELQEKIKNGLKVKVFDIRSKEKYEEFHIDGAIFIEREKILEDPKKYLLKDEKAYITCNGGNSASKIAKTIRDQGYDIEHLIGGMKPLVKEQGIVTDSKTCCKLISVILINLLTF